MRYLLVLLVAGCTHSPTNFDLSNKEPKCARECMTSHSACVSTAGRSIGPIVTNTVLASCDSSASQCLQTCGPK